MSTSRESTGWVHKIPTVISISTAYYETPAGEPTGNPDVRNSSILGAERCRMSMLISISCSCLLSHVLTLRVGVLMAMLAPPASHSAASGVQPRLGGDTCRSLSALAGLVLYKPFLALQLQHSSGTNTSIKADLLFRKRLDFTTVTDM